MMNCENIQDLLPEFAQRDLPDALLGEIAEHLKGCKSCAQEFETELDFLVNLSGLPLVECPAHVTTGILGQIEAEENQSRVKTTNWLLGASTLMAAGLALVLLLPTTNPTPSPDNFSQTEIREATHQAHYALAKVATVINRNESNAFEQVFSKEIAGAVGGSLRHITKNLQGEV